MPSVTLTPDIARTEKIILAESYLTISLNEAENWLYIKWEGERTADKLIHGAEQLLEIVKKTGCKKIINDSTSIATSWPELEDWFALKFAPRLQQAGIQYFAWIYDDQNHIKSFADTILRKDVSDILVMVFDNVKTAEIWLSSLR